MQYSPKLKKAMEEIKAILQKNDIAGFVVLHTPGFSEYLNQVSPSFSCATLENGGWRFRLKSTEVGKERAMEIANATFNMMTHFSEVVGRHALMFIEGQKFLEDKLNGSSGPGSHTSHNEQNN